MRKILSPTLFILLFALSGCYVPKMYQSFEIASKENLKLENHCYTFENDTVKIVYDFFAENGKMWFIIFNKKSSPLYIDWNKSSLIVNSNKVAYWTDNVVTRSKAKADTRYYEVYPYYPLSDYASYLLQRQYSLSESVTSRPERITVVPPQAQCFKVEFNLCDFDIRPDPPYTEVTAERTRLGDFKNTDVTGTLTSKDYTADNSKLAFNNFLTLSFSENFTNEFYITNRFYASKVVEMYKKFYMGKLVNSYTYQYPFISPTKFSKLIPEDESMDERSSRCTYIYKNGHQCTLHKKEGCDYCKSHCH